MGVKGVHGKGHLRDVETGLLCSYVIFTYIIIAYIIDVHGCFILVLCFVIS